MNDQERAEHQRNMNAAFGWIAAGAVVVVALLFMFMSPTDRVASNGKSMTAGQSTTGQSTTGQGSR
jgi:hypothetical protein